MRVKTYICPGYGKDCSIWFYSISDLHVFNSKVAAMPVTNLSKNVIQRCSPVKLQRSEIEVSCPFLYKMLHNKYLSMYNPCIDWKNQMSCTAVNVVLLTEG